MSTEFIRALVFNKYGTTLAVGIGVPIPILDEEMMRCASVTDSEIYAPVLDYSVQSRNKQPIHEVSYAELRSGSIEIGGKRVRTSSLSSYYKAKVIAERLKKSIKEGTFMLTEPVARLPEERSMGSLDLHSREEVA
jgi:uncharacterized protein (DUF39 family)